MSNEAFTNRLIDETSPYLQQHAHNPVDWHPWGADALRRARDEDKPIFLSIGYSACHWCHVMEHESFEDVTTARVMNELFVNIKVDREERPDLDQIYMTATQLITRHGGWPMSVWLTPDLKPFYAGTYFPPTPRHGLPAFADLCRHLGQAWRERRDEVLESADQVVAAVVQQGGVRFEDGPLDASIEREAAQELARLVDRTHGGIGTAPKFPHSTEMRLLLRVARSTGREEYRSLVETTFDHMVRGGIYDQLGGGFHRYSTDSRWLVPHFEKMLYDNALIALGLHEAAQATASEALRAEFRQAVEETLDYVLREMRLPEGAFASTQDADSEGEEGRFFVWTRRALDDVLGSELGDIVAYAYDVNEMGNWEDGKNILHLPRPIGQVAKLLTIPESELRGRLAEAKGKLFDARSKRVSPGRDDKVLTSWNGMMIDTLAVVDGGRNGRLANAASSAAEFVLSTMRTSDGLLLRTYKDGRSRLNGYLEDYAYLANGLVSLYEATFDPRWITASLEIVECMIDEFWDDAEGGFFYTGKRHERLIARGKDPHDSAIPSGNSMAATAMARLSKLTGRGDLSDRTEQTLRLFRSVMKQSAMASSQMMIALGIHRGPTAEFAIVGNREEPEGSELLSVLQSGFLPNKVVAMSEPGSSESSIGPVALLAEKPGRKGEQRVYICQDFACREPIVGVEAFRKEFEQMVRSTDAVEGKR